MFRNRDLLLRMTGVFALVSSLSFLHRGDFIDDALIYAFERVPVDFGPVVYLLRRRPSPLLGKPLR